MASEALKVGDVVKLKSGGPAMTVDDFAKDDKSAYCKWFSNDTKVESAFFAVEALVPVPPAKPEPLL
jgi:uncharacterized protein YodC (DUF2158 family)